MNAEGRSLYPALERVWRWPPVKYLAGAALAMLTGTAIPWVNSRADEAFVLEQLKHATAEDTKPPILERVRALEERTFAQEQRLRALELAEKEIRRQLVGYLAADAEPRRERKAGAAEAVRKMYDDLVRDGLTPKAAALQVLNSPVPR